MRFILKILLFLLSVPLFGQPCSKQYPCDTIGGEPVFIKVETSPKFQGKNLEEFSRYVAQNVKNPYFAIKNNISGIVYIRFVINSEGTLIEPAIIQGLHPKLDDEVLKAVESSPDWEPGKIEDENVSVEYILPVNFTWKTSDNYK